MSGIAQSTSITTSERRSAEEDFSSEAAGALRAHDSPEPEKTWPEIDRRSGFDRRARPTRGWDALFRRGKRLGGRRSTDHANSYVDLYRRRDVAMVVSVFFLNILDAFLTLRWLSFGGSEENPLMEQMLESGDFVFLVQKCFVVGGLLLLLVVHRNFAMARVGMWVLFTLYGGLLLHHTLLQWGVG